MACLRSPEKLKVGNFTSQSCKNGNEMYKKVRCTCKVVVMPTSIVVFDVLVAVASSDLKVSVFKKREPLRRKEMF